MGSASSPDLWKPIAGKFLLCLELSIDWACPTHKLEQISGQAFLPHA